MIEGYVVLSATRQVDGIAIPQTTTTTRQQLPGRYSGTTCVNASYRSDYYMPQRGRSFLTYSSFEDHEFIARVLSDAEGMDREAPYRDKLSSSLASAPTARFSLLVEVPAPGPFIAFLTRNASIHFWGVSSDDAELLLWSDSPDMGDALYPKWWVQPLGVLTDSVIVLHTQRVVQRWSRWRNDGTVNTHQRFLALWRSVLNARLGFA